MSTALSSMFLIIISSFLVVSPLKFCVTAVKLAASLCCPIRQLVTRARATHPRLSRGRPYRTCLPPGKSSADAKDETLTKSNPTSPRDGWYRAPPLWWERYGRECIRLRVCDDRFMYWNRFSDVEYLNFFLCLGIVSQT